MSSSSRTSLILLSLLLIFITVSAIKTDPELKQCEDKCGDQQHHFNPEQVASCYRGCKEYHRAKERGQPDYQGPRKEYEECIVQCGRQSEGSRYPQETCQEDCKRQLKERKHGDRGDHGDVLIREESGNESPYVFKERHFVTGLQSEHGRVRLLPKFTDRSPLLRGIENYRFSIFEAEPQTFVLPKHWDADVVFFVVNGRGTVSLVRQDKRESFNIRQGDVVKICAGTPAYLINRDSTQRLVLAKLIVPVNAPGEFQAYFGAGGGNPESFYTVFSNEILEAAFNTRSESLQRVFGQQMEGFIVKATPEQIRGLSQHEQGGIWPFGGASRGSFNLYEQRPTFANQYGQLYEADSSRFRPLRDLDMIVSLANITQGGMIAPYYNSKTTEIAIVVEGEGYFEMACPHLSEQQGGHQGSQEWQGSRQEQRWQGSRRGSEEQQGGTFSGPRYQRVSSRLKRGTVMVIPAGHPFVAVASKNQNLQVLCFEVNAQDNEKYTLAGRRNVVSQLEREAKELAFGMPARVVDEVFMSQQEEVFFKGPSKQSRQGRAYA